MLFQAATVQDRRRIDSSARASMQDLRSKGRTVSAQSIWLRGADSDRLLVFPAPKSWIQHDLSELLTFFQALMRSSCFAQWEDAIDHRLEFAAENVLQNLVQVTHRSHIGT